jgi:predicted RNase H-like nuclease
MAPRRGPELPYSIVAAATPSRTKWLVASAKVQGGTFAPEQPKVYDTFLEVLDERPSFSSVVVYAPIGYRDTRDRGPRTCDTEARHMLGNRGSLIQNAPTLEVLRRGYAVPEDHLDAITIQRLPSYVEVFKEMSPYRQRQVYEGNPELSFFFLNNFTPLQLSKKTGEGRVERMEILTKRVPNIATVLEAQIPGVSIRNLIDVAAMVASGRRVFTKSAKRIPADAEWDSEGLRMEIVY